MTARMAGPAIRAWHMAEELAAAGHAVRLASMAAVDRRHEHFEVVLAATEELRSLERWMDVLVFQGGLLRIHPFMAETDKVVVCDIYDPFHLENLESTPGEVEHLTGVLNDQLVRGDFFLCASERQRDYWLGALSALGRVNGATYAGDPGLRRLIDVVPFGLSSTAPVHSGQPALRGVVPGIDDRSKVLLWAGGVYPWFDPITLVRAVEQLRSSDLPELRLHFLGLRHPNPAIADSPLVAELRRVAGKGVSFNDGWVDYERRGDFLLEADVGVSTHHDHVETAFSFRTRMLDYLWAGLPMVSTAGDAFAELIHDERLGATAAADDVDALAAAIARTVSDPPPRERVQQVAERFTWPTVMRPLVEFCRQPRRAADAERPQPGWLKRILRGRT